RRARAPREPRRLAEPGGRALDLERAQRSRPARAGGRLLRARRGRIGSSRDAARRGVEIGTVNPRALLRFIPALLATLWTALASAPAGPVRATGAGAGSPALNSACDQVLQSSSGGTWAWINPGGGFTQPLGVQANAAACSLTFQWYLDDDGIFRVYQWNPQTLAPDPTTVALRSISFSPSQLQFNHMKVTFYPPVVTRKGEHLAEPPGDMIALDFQVGPYLWEQAAL